MFEGLDDIDWASLEHAYGTAEEVPALLRALRSTHTEERHLCRLPDVSVHPDIILDSGLSAISRFLYVVLLALPDDFEMDEAAALAGAGSKHSLDAHLAELVTAGLIQIDEEEGEEILTIHATPQRRTFSPRHGPVSRVSHH
ncbi:hypothetical protein ABZZ74_47725 [Streptomyces sp. NPDC006476]|uniref:hypothetical protein n=1 Tax=Streptomyces sp. NPDC006476 TaxID=3157175 RepID=UPI0033A88EF6